MTTAEKLVKFAEQQSEISNIFNAIRSAIIAKGVNVPLAMSPREYAARILLIEGGGTGGEGFTFAENVNMTTSGTTTIEAQKVVETIILNDLYTFTHSEGVTITYS
jgi:hypothetical protein